MSGKSSATADARPRVLYDGWPLIYSPGSPAAFHLRDLLELIQNEIDPWLAVPAGGSFSFSPGIGQICARPTANTPFGRLLWEQAILPQLCRRSGADVLHSLSANLPIVAPIPCISSPDGIQDGLPQAEKGALSRVRFALGRGGLAGAAAVLWPDDLADPTLPSALVRLPAFVSPQFQAAHLPPAGLPANYLLLAGPIDGAALLDFSQAWEIASPHIGEEVALVASDFSPQVYQRLCILLRSKGIPEPVDNLDLSTPGPRAAAFAHADALVILGQTAPWGDLVSQSLACACALIAIETPWSDARVGGAGYLVPSGDPRALAAAVLTLATQPEVGEQIRHAARLRSADWHVEAFKPRLLELYHQQAGLSAPA